MKDIAELIRAIASLLWPILTFTALYIFRQQLRDILARLKRGKLLGQEIELDKSLHELNESAQAAASDTPEIEQQVVEFRSTSPDRTTASGIERKILDEASRSPKVALILLSSELEREVRQLLASTGRLEDSRTPLIYAIQTFEKSGLIPRHIVESVKSFYQIRNRLVHGHSATDDDIVRAIDSGLTILRTIQAIPYETNTVYHPGVDVYEDAMGEKLRKDIKAVVLETLSPGGARRNLRAFPTTKSHFQKGKRVAWEWNGRLIVGESWYRHPDTDDLTYGWTSSMEFIGRHLEEV